MSELPSHGRCQFGRTDLRHNTRQMPRCRDRAMPGHFYCTTHNAEAMARLPDRSIGDARGLRWTTWTTLARGDG